MATRDHRFEICRQSDLDEGAFREVAIRYRDIPYSSIVFRLQDKVYAYLNQCVHMPRRLNCERHTIFDAKGDHLRCSMHGIVYDPARGESISTLCNGERLTPIKLSFSGEQIYFDDKRVSVVNQSALEATTTTL